MNEVFLDTETTGLSVQEDHRIVEIACIETKDLIPTKKKFHKLINPERKVEEDALKIHGHTDEMLKGEKKFNFKNTKNLKRKVKNLIKKDKKKLKELESIIHPLVRKEMETLMKPRKNIKISIFEIPLLIESKLTKYFDVVVFVGANKNIRLKRYLYKGGNKKIFTILDNRQIKPSKKIKISNHVIYNNKSLKALKKNVKFLMKKYE